MRSRCGSRRAPSTTDDHGALQANRAEQRRRRAFARRPIERRALDALRLSSRAACGFEVGRRPDLTLLSERDLRERDALHAVRLLALWAGRRGRLIRDELLELLGAATTCVLVKRHGIVLSRRADQHTAKHGLW